MNKIIPLYTLLLFSSCFTSTAQYNSSLRDGKACSMITQTQLNTYLSQLKNLATIAQQDKETFGTTGAYPATAIQFHLYASIAYDSLQVTINWLNTGSDNIADNTNYVEAMTIKYRMAEIINLLIAANHWAELSAIYHKSAYASCGREQSMKLLAEAVNLLAYSSQCYFEPYKKEIPQSSCR